MGEPILVPCPDGRFQVGSRAAIQTLPIGCIQDLIDADDDLFCPAGGHQWKREAGFDTPTIGYVSGVYRYALIDPAGGPSVATEAQLVYADPTGTNARTPDGHARWAVNGHLAVARSGIAWDGCGPIPELDLGDWGERLAIRPAEARTLAQLDRLQAAFPERRLRPFVRYQHAVVDPLRNDRHVVPVTLDVDLPPDRWLEATWRNLPDGERLALCDRTPRPTGAVRARTIREVLHVWRIPHDPTTEPVEAVNHVLSPGVRRVLPVRSRPELVELVGKEGDDLYVPLVDPSAAPGEQLTVYRSADTWAPVLEKARTLGTAELCRRTGLARSTVYHLLAGRTPSPDTAVLVAMAVEGVEVDSVAQRASVGGWHPCARTGCDRLVRARQRWCTPGCRKAVQRARERLVLQGVGGARCAKCGTVRFGDRGSECPVCMGDEKPSVLTILCPGCGVERVGDTSSPCRVCEKELRR